MVKERDDLSEAKKLEFDIPVKDSGNPSIKAVPAEDAEPPQENGPTTPDSTPEADDNPAEDKKRVRPIDHPLEEESTVDEAEIAALLMKFEAENNRYPEYPSWRKGALWGVLTLLMLIWAVYSLYKEQASGAPDFSGSVLPFFFMLLTLILWLLATFRPGNE